jgi:uncharacterized protein YcbK (DUF882 family)
MVNAGLSDRANTVVNIRIAKFSGTCSAHRFPGKTVARWFVAFCLIMTTLLLGTIDPASARSRSLKLYFTHTKESISVTYKRNGKYLPGGLKKLNRFLRDWRRNEPTRMDPRLFDLVWEVYQRSGSRKPIHVISGYRSPKTNAALRRRGRKVASKSQHMKGKALDFFLPDVSVDKIRALGLKAHVGGVGYYRGSFVHLDTGSVRHWPRMSRRQLARVFPRGRTLHVPSDGKPMAGYQFALAKYKKRKRTGGPILIASAAPRKSKSAKGGLLKRMFGGGRDEEGDRVIARKPAKKPRKTVVAAKNPNKSKKSQLPGVVVSAVSAVPEAEPKPPEVLLSVIPKRVIIPKQRPGSIKAKPADVLLASVEPAKDVDKAATLVASRFASNTPTRPTLRPPLKIRESRFALAAIPELTPTQKAAEILSRMPVKPVARPVEKIVVAAKPKDTTVTLASLAPVENTETSKRVPQPAAPEQPPITSVIKKVLQPVKQSRVALPKRASRIERTFAALSTIREKTAPVPKSKPVEIASLSPAHTTPTAKPVDMFGAELKTIKPKKSVRPPAQKKRPRRIVLQTAKFQLGNLDSESVAIWATSKSTRVGKLARLTAPRYLGVLENAPISIYNGGFDRAQPINRTNRFSGQAIKRIAFAKFMTSSLASGEAFPTDRY